MQIDPIRQAEALLLAALIGLGAGFVYDLLRPPRWHGRALRAFLADALFCLILGAALFLYAMSFGEGRLGLGALASAWTGFLAYHALLSPRLLPIFVNVYQYLDKMRSACKKRRKKPLFLKNNTLKMKKNAL